MIGWLTFGKINELLKSAAHFLFSLQHQLKKICKAFFLIWSHHEGFIHRGRPLKNHFLYHDKGSHVKVMLRNGFHLNSNSLSLSSQAWKSVKLPSWYNLLCSTTWRYCPIASIWMITCTLGYHSRILLLEPLCKAKDWFEQNHTWILFKSFHSVNEIGFHLSLDTKAKITL